MDEHHGAQPGLAVRAPRACSVNQALGCPAQRVSAAGGGGSSARQVVADRREAGVHLLDVGGHSRTRLRGLEQLVAQSLLEPGDGTVGRHCGGGRRSRRGYRDDRPILNRPASGHQQASDRRTDNACGAARPTRHHPLHWSADGLSASCAHRQRGPLIMPSDRRSCQMIGAITVFAAAASFRRGILKARGFGIALCTGWNPCGAV